MTIITPIHVTFFPDNLTQQQFEFIEIDCHLYLERYRLLTRPDIKSKKWTVRDRYNRLGRSNENTLTEDQVPLTPALRQEALQQYVSQLKCLKWSERIR
jgi:hypothetical protein